MNRLLQRYFGFRFLGPYAPLASLFVMGLLVLSISRVALVAWHFERVGAVDGFGFVLLQGVRADIIILSFILFFPTLLAPLFSLTNVTKRYWEPLLAVWLSAMLLLLIFMELSTPSFINEYDTRPDRIFVEYLKYPAEVFSTLFKAYTLQLIITAVVMFFAVRVTWRHFAGFIGAPSGMKRVHALLLLPVLIILLIVGGRSSLQHRPANPSLFAFSTDNLVNKLPLSSTYSVLFAIYNLKHEQSSSEVYGEMDPTEVVERVRNTMAVDADSFVDNKMPTLHRQVATVKRERPLNLVIVLEESLGAGFVESLGGIPVTPNLERLSKEGLWFKRMYATGTRSVRGIESVLTGFAPTPARSVVKLEGSQRNFFTIADLLGERGYHTEFIYGGESHFDNMRGFFLGNGFQSIVDQRDYPNPKFVSSWGASDEDLFDKALERFDQLHLEDAPFFSLIFTSSNHSPFEVPENTIELYDEGKNTVNNAVKYADYALGRFFDAVKEKSYYSDTIFLIVADHDTRAHGASLIPINKFQIPALIIAPGVEPSEYEAIASQLDLPPTILSLMGIDSIHPMIGHDLTIDNPKHGRALMQFQSTFGYMRDDQVAIFQPEKAPQQFSYSIEDHSLSPVSEPNSELIANGLANSLLPPKLYREKLYQTHKE
ncbi:MAG: LTA synthase family protein [Gammaproteobacteria bacterium]|nr:LTA synthase family protein [Gammaproteobacteria bacterium]